MRRQQDRPPQRVARARSGNHSPFPCPYTRTCSGLGTVCEWSAAAHKTTRYTSFHTQHTPPLARRAATTSVCTRSRVTSIGAPRMVERTINIGCCNRQQPMLPLAVRSGTHLPATRSGKLKQLVSRVSTYVYSAAPTQSKQHASMDE